MLAPGCLAKYGDGEISLVLMTTQWGAIAWPMDPVVHGDSTIYLPRKPVENKQGLRYLSVWDLDDWQAAEVMLLPPSSRKQAAVEPGSLQGVWILARGDFKSLMVYSAERGFFGVGVQFLKKLMSVLNMKFAVGERPTTEVAVLTALLRQVLPWASVDRLREILCSRTKRLDEADDPSLFLKANGVEVAGHLLDSFDVDEVKGCGQDKEKRAEHDRDYKEKVEKVLPPLAPPSPVKEPLPAIVAPEPEIAAPEAPAAAVEPQALIPIALGPSKTPAEAKLMLPQVPGCTIKEETLRYNRWQVAYLQHVDFPKSHSCTYGDGSVISRMQALRTCLKWVWQIHALYSEDRCPFDFDN